MQFVARDPIAGGGPSGEPGGTLPGWARRLDAVRAGQCLLVITGVLVVGTLPLLGVPSAALSAALAVDAAIGLLLLISLRLPWYRWPLAATLAFPSTTLVGLAVLGLQLDGAGMAYAGLFVLSFAYLGLMHPPGTGWRMLPLALVCYLGMADSSALRILVRMAIVAVVWLLLAELLSRLAARNAAMTASLQTALDTDTLTGVGSRRSLDARLRGISRSDSIAVIDLDHFKAVNDKYGHCAGDVVLREFGETLRAHVRPHDFVARYGGEEFVLVLAGTTPSQGLEVIARVRTAWHRVQPGVTFSSGLAGGPEEGRHDRLLSTADAALYRAKAAGRDRDVVATAPVRAQPPV
jgi:diguanylate cyclase (GGDEF)-like protein